MISVSENIVLPVEGPEVFQVITNLEKLLRISPYRSLKSLKAAAGDGAGEGERYEAVLEDYANETSAARTFYAQERVRDRKAVWEVDSGVMKEISLTISERPEGALLTLSCSIACDDRVVIDDARSEIRYWLRSIGEYVKLSAGKGLRPRIFKWFMDRVWLKLALSERNITIIITKITIVEILFLFVLLLVWNFFGPPR